MFAKWIRRPEMRGAVFLVLLGMTAPLVMGQTTKGVSPLQLLPENTGAYFSWTGTTANLPAWKKTAAFETLTKLNSRETLSTWLSRLGEMNPALGTSLPLLEQLCHDGVTAGLALNSTPENTAEIEFVAVLHEAAVHEPVITEWLSSLGDWELTSIDDQDVQRMVPANPDLPEIGYWVEGPHLVLAAGTNAIANTRKRAKGESRGLSNVSVDSVTGPSRKDQPVVSTAWVDVETLTRTVGRIETATFAPALAGSDLKSVNDLLDFYGLGGSLRLVWRQQLDGPAIRSIYDCTASGNSRGSGNKSGVFQIYELVPLTLAQLPSAPKPTAFFTAGSVPLADWYRKAIEFNERLAEVTSQASSANTVAEQVNEQLGFDLEKDLLAELGPCVACYHEPGAKVPFVDTSFGAMWEVRDRAKVNAAVKSLVARVEPLQAQLPGLFKLAKSRKQGADIYSVGMPPMPVWPAFAVTEKWIVFGLNVDTVVAGVKRLAGDGPGQKLSAKEARFAKVPKEFYSLTISDPRPMVEGYAATLAAGAQQTGLAEFEVPDLDPAEVKKATKGLFEGLAFSHAGPSGYHWEARHALPVIPPSPSYESLQAIVLAVAPVSGVSPILAERALQRQVRSQQNLLSVGVGLAKSAERSESFPRGSIEGVQEVPNRQSWLVALLPDLDGVDLGREDLDLASLSAKFEGRSRQEWNDPFLKEAVNTPIPLLRNPALRLDPSVPAYSSDYAGVAGLTEKGPFLKKDEPGAGIFSHVRSTRLKDITDGTANTLCVGEVAQHRGPWAKAGNETVRPFVKKPYLGGKDGWNGAHAGGTLFLMADGSVRLMSHETDSEVIEALATIAGGEEIETEPEPEVFVPPPFGAPPGFGPPGLGSPGVGPMPADSDAPEDSETPAGNPAPPTAGRPAVPGKPASPKPVPGKPKAGKPTANNPAPQAD